MVILNRIYTKTGDKGQTSLGDGNRVSKTSDRVEAYGTVDELNSFIGLTITYSFEELTKDLKRIQNDLFDIGADLCVPQKDNPESLRVVKSQVEWLEKSIDNMNEKLSPLESFVLPGGSKLSSSLHVCRTICRRAERQSIKLDNQEKINTHIIIYLNRLSDWFFISSRIANNFGKQDVLWIPGANR